MSAPFPEGTLVCLKTGGPLMTVESISTSEIVSTVWIVDGVVHRDGFHPAHLNAFVGFQQLPEGMKDCTIWFKECAKGHGRLTAKNWVQHDCWHCEIDRLRLAAKDACDLLAERTQGNTARSPGHNARLLLEAVVFKEPDYSHHMMGPCLKDCAEKRVDCGHILCPYKTWNAG